MTNIKSSKKFFIKSKKQRKYNMSHRSKLRTFIKKVYILIKNKKIEKATHTFLQIQKIIDQQTQKGLIHKNKAARYKSKISSRIYSIVNK